MPSSEPLPHGHFRAPRSVVATFAGLLGAPLVFLAGLHVLYALVSWSCRAEHTILLHVGHVLALLLTIAAAALSAREWRRAGRGWPGEAGKPADRSRFIAACGAMLATLVALIVLAQWLSLAFFSPCVGA